MKEKRGRSISLRQTHRSNSLLKLFRQEHLYLCRIDKLSAAKKKALSPAADQRWI
jgi:hypothetical protein